jgi:hypothetical protein
MSNYARWFASHARPAAKPFRRHYVAVIETRTSSSWVSKPSAGTHRESREARDTGHVFHGSVQLQKILVRLAQHPVRGVVGALEVKHLVFGLPHALLAVTDQLVPLAVPRHCPVRT